MILHCDLNHFYALVELLSRPALRHVPLAVCGSCVYETGAAVHRKAGGLDGKYRTKIWAGHADVSLLSIAKISLFHCRA